MSGILFLLLALAAAKLTLWQAGLLASITGTTPPETDYTIVGLSFAAAIIFFGLWLAGKIHQKQSKTNLIFD